MKWLYVIGFATVAVLCIAILALFVRTAPHETRAPAAPPPMLGAIGATEFRSINLAASSGVVKTASGNVYGVTCINRNDAGVYLQLFNQTTAPAGATVPQDQWFVPPLLQTIAGQELTVGGEAFDGGISFGVSTTGGSFTAATAASSDVMVTYQ